jgi:hypothetical protein
MAERVSALYNEDEDALLLAMLGQEYIVRHEGIFLHGQKARWSRIGDHRLPLSTGTALTMTPWRTIVEFSGRPLPDFRKS